MFHVCYLPDEVFYYHIKENLTNKDYRRLCNTSKEKFQKLKKETLSWRLTRQASQDIVNNRSFRNKFLSRIEGSRRQIQLSSFQGTTELDNIQSLVLTNTVEKITINGRSHPFLKYLNTDLHIEQIDQLVFTGDIQINPSLCDRFFQLHQLVIKLPTCQLIQNENLQSLKHIPTLVIGFQTLITNLDGLRGGRE